MKEGIQLYYNQALTLSILSHLPKGQVAVLFYLPDGKMYLPKMENVGLLRKCIKQVFV